MVKFGSCQGLNRQQEEWRVLVASRYNGDYHIPIEVQHMHYIHSIGLLCDLFIDIKHVQITWIDTIWVHQHRVSLKI